MAWTDLFENLSVNSLKGDLSNATTVNPPLFSLVNTFKTVTGHATVETFSLQETDQLFKTKFFSLHLPFWIRILKTKRACK
jgi:hypothetical protein